MLIGSMNHPARNIFSEIEWMSGMGLEFIDLTLEPPETASWKVDAHAIRSAIEQHRMRVVGHTAYYLPLASAIPEIRAAAVQELRRCMRVFHEVGASWMNIHPDHYTPMHERGFFIRNNIESLKTLLEEGGRSGMGLMIENLPGDFNTVAQLGELLDPLPNLGLHLDFGHANLRVPHSTAGEILATYGSRLRHVHLHDNRGGDADLHLPLGTGSVDVNAAVKMLKSCGYDGTITLEVFTPDRRHLTFSRDVLRAAWNGDNGSAGRS